MATSGQKRKLEETDISPESDIPLKQAKLSPAANDIPTKETKVETTTDATTNKEETPLKEEQKESKPTDTKPASQDDKTETEILDKDTLQKLQQQVEYYFSNSNLPLDNHIIETSKLACNKGYFPVAGLLRFKLIKALTTSIDTIIRAIEASSKLQFNDSKDAIRRHPNCGPLPTKEDIHQRTIFAKGFHPRTTRQQLLDFWKTHADESTVLSVRNIRDNFHVGIGEDNKLKMVRRFLGNCSVEFASADLAQAFSHMTFSCNGRLIKCGMYQSYWKDDIEWKINKQYHDFEPNKILFIREIPTYSTYTDIKNWICNSLYARKKKKDSVNKVEFVYKELNTGVAYARFGTECDILNCVQLLKKKALMGIYPKLAVLNDEQASKVWKKLAGKPLDANTDVEIKVNNKLQKDKEEQDDDEDTDMKNSKEKDENQSESCTNNKKAETEDASSSQPKKEDSN